MPDFRSRERERTELIYTPPPRSPQDGNQALTAARSEGDEAGAEPAAGAPTNPAPEESSEPGSEEPPDPQPGGTRPEPAVPPVPPPAAPTPTPCEPGKTVSGRPEPTSGLRSLSSPPTSTSTSTSSSEWLPAERQSELVRRVVGGHWYAWACRIRTFVKDLHIHGRGRRIKISLFARFPIVSLQPS